VSTDKVPAVFGMHASPKHSTESSSLPALWKWPFISRALHVRKESIFALGICLAASWPIIYCWCECLFWCACRALISLMIIS
jgi:hypothetical protein